MDRYAVVGHPIAHSLSPRIHDLFARQCAQAMTYEALLAPLAGFANTVTAFLAAGGRGLNVTLPFKTEAYALAERYSERAALTGVVNTLAVTPQGLYGDNTDGIGLIRDLERLGMTPVDKTVLVLGAGGAVQGVLPALLALRPARLVLANRTPSKAIALAERFADLGPIEPCGLTELMGQRFALIVNGTAASLDNQLPPLPDQLLAVGGGAYDLVYSDTPTPFLRWCHDQGAAQAADGLGMLVAQAAAAFALWRGVWPEIDPVLSVLRPG